MNIQSTLAMRVLRIVAIVVSLGCASSLLNGCHPSEPVAAAKSEAAPAAKEAAQESVTLKPEEVDKLGITTVAAKQTTFTPEKSGYGVVVAHEVIAQAVADAATAEAAIHQSRAALARIDRLAGTPGAFPIENKEAAERQAAVDAAALTLAQQKLSASLGQNPPWKDGDKNSMLSELANGHIKIVRVTFPLGVFSGGAPSSLRIAHLDPNSASESWKTASVWNAPADANVPGRSFFALLKTADVGEGEHVQVWAPAGAPVSGVLIPSTATVIHDGKYWCYVEKESGAFERVEVDTGKPIDDNYFVTENIAPGDAIVTSATGLLLARETNTSTEAE